MWPVQPEPIIYREAILFALADINVKLSRIVTVLQDDDEEDEDEP